MPIITMEGPKLSKKQKTELIKRFTKVANEVIDLPEEAFIVLLKEMEADNVGVGGTLLSEREK